MLCLFCKSDGPFSTVEHIVPESLGNKHILLDGQICDACQRYLGAKIEEYVLRRSPIGWWRVHAGVQTKNGNPPRFSFTQPKREKGILPDRHRSNDDSVEFLINDDGDREFSVGMPDILERIEHGAKTQFKLVLTPKMLHMMGRFFGKVGLEMLARDQPDFARSPRFDSARRFVRFGEPLKFLWPIFHIGSEFRPESFPAEVAVFDTDGLIRGGDSYTLSCFRLGSETWVICLNDPCPHPIIRNSFPNDDLQLITY